MKKGYQKIISLMLIVVLGMTVISCGGADPTPTWQEQYDLGVRYLSEGNYSEAIIAFTAAIEINPKEVDTYLGLADAYEALGDIEQAKRVLTDALSVVDDLSIIQERLDKLLGMEEAEEENSTETSAEEYRSILTYFYNGISTQWVDYDDYGYGILTDPNEFTFSYMWYLEPVDSLSDAGYAFIDLDGNGIHELLVSRLNNNGWDSDAGMIYDLYTYRDGKVIHLASSGERDRFYLCSDFTIANEGSGGSRLNGYDYYTLDENSSRLYLGERVLYDAWTDEDNPWFYGTENAISDATQMTHITDEDAMKIINKYEYISYELIPFSSYSGGQEQTPWQENDLESERELEPEPEPEAESELPPIMPSDFAYAGDIDGSVWHFYEDSPSSSDTYIGQFNFSELGDLYFLCGWAYSEISGSYSGNYSLRDSNKLYLELLFELLDDEVDLPISETYEYEVVMIDSDNISLTQISETGPFYYHEAGHQITLTKGAF